MHARDHTARALCGKESGATASAERMVIAGTSQSEQWLSVLNDQEWATLATPLGKLAPWTVQA